MGSQELSYGTWYIHELDLKFLYKDIYIYGGSREEVAVQYRNLDHVRIAWLVLGTVGNPG